MQSPEQAWRIPRKDRRTAANVQGAGFLLLLAGLLFSPAVAVGGAVVLAVGLCIPSRKFCLCGRCGNAVETTSTLCPACRVSLVKRPLRVGVLGTLAGVACALLVLAAGVVFLFPELAHALLFKLGAVK